MRISYDLARALLIGASDKIRSVDFPVRTFNVLEFLFGGGMRRRALLVSNH